MFYYEFVGLRIDLKIWWFELVFGVFLGGVLKGLRGYVVSCGKIRVKLCRV